MLVENLVTFCQIENVISMLLICFYSELYSFWMARVEPMLQRPLWSNEVQAKAGSL